MITKQQSSVQTTPELFSPRLVSPGRADACHWTSAPLLHQARWWRGCWRAGFCQVPLYLLDWSEMTEVCRHHAEQWQCAGSTGALLLLSWPGASWVSWPPPWWMMVTMLWCTWDWSLHTEHCPPVRDEDQLLYTRVSTTHYSLKYVRFCTTFLHSNNESAYICTFIIRHCQARRCCVGNELRKNILYRWPAVSEMQLHYRVCTTGRN